MITKEDFHINTDGSDELLYIDYYLIKDCYGFDGEAAISNIDNFMNYNGHKYEIGQRNKVASNFSNLSEKPYYPCLGNSENGSNGRGVSEQKFIEILDLFKEKGDIIALIHGNVFSPVFVYGYGPDLNSDLLIALIVEQISDYTKKVAKINNFDTETESAKSWNPITEDWETITITLARCNNKNEFHLIVPEDMLTDRLPYSASDFLSNYWRPKLNAKNEKKGIPEMNKKEFSQWLKDNGYSEHDYLMEVIEEISYQELVDYMTRSKKRSIINKNKRFDKE